MRKFGILIFVLMLGTSAAFAQKQKSEPQVVDPGSKKSNASSPSSIKAGTRLEAELAQTIDAKRARVGDEVVLKTTSTVKQDGRVVVAKGSRIIGRITEVASRSKSSGLSRLGVIFDRIEGKNLDSPISASVITITDSRTGASFDGPLDAGMSSHTSTRSSASTSGGGLLSGVGSTVGGLVDTTAKTSGTVVGAATDTLGSTTGTVGRTLSGLQINNSASGSAAGATTLSTARRDIRLEKGVNFHLLINGGR